MSFGLLNLDAGISERRGGVLSHLTHHLISFATCIHVHYQVHFICSTLVPKARTSITLRFASDSFLSSACLTTPNIVFFFFLSCPILDDNIHKFWYYKYMNFAHSCRCIHKTQRGCNHYIGTKVDLFFRSAQLQRSLRTCF